jgi:hypothetical protein
MRIFDSITATAQGVDRLEPCPDWKPYVAAAIPKPVKCRHPTTGAIGAEDGIRTRDPLLGKEMRYHCATSARLRANEIISSAPSSSGRRALEAVKLGRGDRPTPPDPLAP